MNYLHNVDINCEAGPAIRHFREGQRPSGLIEITEIARTHINGALARTPSDIIIPNRWMVGETGESPNPIDILAGSVEAPNLDKFVSAGVEAWDRLVTSIGAVGGRAVMIEAERREAVIEPRDDGLIIVSQANPVDAEFKGFYGTTDELEQLRELESRINARATTDIDDGRDGLYA